MTAAHRWTAPALTGAILACLAAQALLAFRQEANWDEFYYLSFVHDYQADRLTKALQTIHVHLFGWLPRVGVHELRQIGAGRLAMLACEGGTIALIYRLARLFATRDAALVAALAYATASTTLLHGASFRADPLAAFLTMAGLYLAFVTQRAWLAAPFIAVAALVTIKVALFAPAFAAAAMWRYAQAPDKRAAMLDLGLAVLAALVMAGALYAGHQALLPAADLGGAGALAGSAWTTTLAEAGLFPQARIAALNAAANPVHTALLAGGAFALWRRWRARAIAPATAAAIALLALPLASFAFYRNAFPYFLPFIFPPALVLVALAADAVRDRGWPLLGLGAVLAGAAALVLVTRPPDARNQQEAVVAAVHRIFPQPVAYIDRSSMIAGFPKQGIFMSTWGVTAYRRAGRPIFDRILAKHAPPLLLANGPGLHDAMNGTATARAEERLLAADAATLRGAYVRHWGPVWVAGTAVELRKGEVPFTVAIPGRYRIESVGPVTINGRQYLPGSLVDLSRGAHRAASPSPQMLTLCWAAARYRPKDPPPAGPLFRGF
jgi:hypothetical protein